MKYQIYLNKETSEFIEFVAKNDKKKPATVIKHLVESLFKGLGEAMTEEQRKEVSKSVADIIKEDEGEGEIMHLTEPVTIL